MSTRFEQMVDAITDLCIQRKWQEAGVMTERIKVAHRHALFSALHFALCECDEGRRDSNLIARAVDEGEKAIRERYPE